MAAKKGRKGIKLMTKISVFFGVSTLLILLLSGLINYSMIKRAVEQRIDKRLAREKVRIEKLIKENPDSIYSLEISFLIQIEEITDGSIQSDASYSKVVRDELDNEPTNFRFLRTTVEANDKKYALTLKRSIDETTTFAESIYFTFGVSFVLILLMLISVQVFFIRKAWAPFYETLNALTRTNLYTDKVEFKPTNIREFTELNQELNKFSSKIHEEFKSQRQYSENLSHELLTPLAIIRTKTELLLQSSGLTEEDLLNLDAIISTVNRLSRINQGLILLSKIDHGMYVDRQAINIIETIHESLEGFEMQIRHLQLKVRLDLDESFYLMTNKTLFEILISNLIKNAVYHNLEHGSIQISMRREELKIINTGKQTSEGTERFFNRFVSEASSGNSIGLGLSIVAKICQSLNYKIHYEVIDSMHIVTVRFTSSEFLQNSGRISSE